MKLTPKVIAMNIRSTCGRTLSHVSTSFEKRLRMRPSGVTSKNVMGSRITAHKRMVCIPLAAAMVPSENVIDTMNCDRTEMCHTNMRSNDVLCRVVQANYAPGRGGK